MPERLDRVAERGVHASTGEGPPADLARAELDARAFGYPDFYGRNLDAWIDCLSGLDAPDEGMTRVHAPSGGMLTLQIDDAADLKARCAAQFEAIVEGAAFVKVRRLELGQPAVLASSFDRR